MPDITSLQIKVDSTQVKQGTTALNDLGKAGSTAEAGVKKIESASETMSAALRTAAIAAAGLFASLQLIDKLKDISMLAARYETLGVVMKVVGNNVGYTGREMEKYTKELQKNGIAMIESRETLTKMAAAHIDLAKANGLARIAQDAAVIGNVNSSEAFSRMIDGIQRGETEIMKTIGLNVDFMGSQQKLAKELGITTQQLTPMQKVLSNTNEAFRAGTGIAGSYEAAMGTAGKMANSLKRYIDDIKVSLGGAFGPAMTLLIGQLTDSLKETNSQLKNNKKAVNEWGNDFRKTLIDLEIHIQGIAILIDLLGGNLTIAGKALFAFGNAIGNENSEKQYAKMIDLNKMFEQRAIASSVAIEKLRYERDKDIKSIKELEKVEEDAKEATRMRLGLAAQLHAEATEQASLDEAAKEKTGKIAAKVAAQEQKDYQGILDRLLPLVKEQKDYNEALAALDKMDPTHSTELYLTALDNLNASLTANVEKAKELREEVDRLAGNIKLGTTGPDELRNAASTDQVKQQHELLKLQNEYNEAVDKQVAIQAELGKAYGLSAAEAEKLKAAFASEQIKKEVDALSYLSTFSGQDFGNEIAEGVNRAALSVSKMNEMFEKQMDLQDKISKKREKISKDTSMDAKDRKKALEELDNLESSMISDQLSGYSNLFGTLGQLFDENSQARKNMHTLEMAFAAAEIAMNLQKALTNAVVAITNQGEGDPYTAFARIAAMVAVMGGIVGMIGGSISGGSGSAVSQTPTATTGTVFGDSTAQSASLQNSTDILETYAEKQYSELRGIYSEMVSLNANITGLVSGLIRSVGGQFKGGIISDVVSQSPKLVSWFIDPLSTWLFGDGKLARWMWGGTEKSVTGAGINVSPTKIGDILSGGSANVQQYQDIKTKKTGLFGGLFGGNSTSNSTEYKAMSEDVNRLFTQVIADMGNSIIDLTKGLGGDISTALSYAFSIPKLDLMGKTGSEITEVVQAAISTAFDNAADAILGDIVGKYQQVSEGMFETAVRVYSEQVIVLDALGKTGNSASGDLLELTQSIIDLAGGSQEFLKSFENYIELFTSDNEKVAASLKFLNESFSDLGFTLPSTRDGFKELISSLDVTTAAGQKAYVSLIGLADSADQVYSVVEDVMTDINERLKLEGMTDLEKEVYNINKTFNEYTNTLIAAGHAGEDLILVEKQRANEIDKVTKAEEEARQKSISQISASVSDVLRVDSISDFENAIYLVNEKYKEMTANLKDLEAGSMDLIRVEQARVVEINNLVEANKKAISDATSGISVSIFTSAMSDMEKSIYDIGVSFDATRARLTELGVDLSDAAFDLVDEGQKLAMQKLSDDFFSTFNDAFSEIGMTDFEKSLRQLRAEYESNIATAKTLTDDEELLNMVRAVSDDKIKALYAEQKALYAEQLKSNLDKAISDLEDSIDETTNALQKALDDANEALSTATDNLKRAFEKENESITSAFDLIVEGMQAGIDSAKEKASEAKSAFDAIDSALKSLLGNDLLKSYSFQEAQDDLLRRSKTKDFSGDLSGTLSSATNFDTKNFASATDYARSFLKTSIMLTEMKGTAETQLSAADLTVKRLEEGLEDAKKQNEALLQSNNDRLNALLGIDESTMTVEEAIVDFQKQQKEALRANDLLEKQTEWMSAQYNALLGINSSVINLGAAIAAVIAAKKATTGFATGGSFVVSGSGGIDNLSLPDLRVSAGEMVNVSRGDVMGALHKEISELRKEVAGLRRESIKHNASIEKNTAATAKQLKRWDGDGMPDARVF